MASTKLYHLIPVPMEGKTLFPLNQLKAVDLAAYQRHRKKYQGREALLDRRIPPLACLWNDVLHLCLVDPHLIRDAKLAAGLPWPQRGRAVAAFDTAGGEFTPDNTAIWHPSPTRTKGDFGTPAKEFTPYHAHHLGALGDLPDRTRQHFEDCAKTGQQSFLFMGIPHVLHRGALSLEICQIMRV
ncbi:hypothetical protein [Actibacterium sp. 188UL27-1]|uniref:hypothetical protein n=1 Tax=Actibacterium sp. 188UL27-1 TaxID=2786961 RepID=UPI00195C7A70|nr:hypothetical protein [Actibacterium sp. 188UL27-1]MBM7067988.1 hypothetical protein [Actibacterium sp. 188UL27-1]